MFRRFKDREMKYIYGPLSMNILTENRMGRRRVADSVIERLALAHGTGKYVFDLEYCRTFIREIKSSFNTLPVNTTIAYSIKANYHQNLLKLATEEGLAFDCASEKEVDIALAVGIETSRIWVNTPFLTDELLEKCVREGIRIHVDSMDQLEDLYQEATRQRKQLEYGIRFNFPETDISRFGIEVSEQNISRIKTLLKAYTNLHLKVLHTHFSGPDRSAEKFSKRADAIASLYNQHFSSYDGLHINFGGGIFGPMMDQFAAQFSHKPAKVEDYTAALKRVIIRNNLNGVNLTIEPGMAIAAHSFYFIAEVLHLKEINGKSIVLLNTSNLFLKPTGHSRDLFFEVVSKSKGRYAKHQLVGITCMESDVLGVYTGELAEGDLVFFHNVGAYTMSYRPDFIFNAPETILLADEFINEFK